MRVCSLFSGGKDSTYALHWAFLKGFKVKCLVTLEPARGDSWMFHRPAVGLTRLQAQALGLPQVYRETTGERDVELEDLREALSEAVRRYQVEGVVTGALLSDYQRMNINIICEELGLRVYSPLWRKNQSRYLKELVDMGFEFIITAIDVYGLGPRFLGRVLTRRDVEEIVALASKYGFNPAFEGGEAETLVVYAPLFKKRLKVHGRVVRAGPYSWRYIIESARLVSVDA